MSISTFNFQFYNYKLPSDVPVMTVSSFSELEMDIDEEDEEMMATPPPSITSTPLPQGKQTPTPRFTSELALAITSPHGTCQPLSKPKPQLEEEEKKEEQPLQALRPQLHKSQKRWSMELREKVLEMSKRSNAAEGMQQVTPSVQDANATFCTSNGIETASSSDAEAEADVRSVSDKINFFNKLTNTYESARGSNPNLNPTPTPTPTCNNNRFISLLRSSRPINLATVSANGQIPPPKPKRLGATDPLQQQTLQQQQQQLQHQFAMPIAKAPTVQRKCSLRRKPSMEKSRATISRQNSSCNASLRPQRHAMMEDLSLVVPVRLRIAEYEQRISMSA